MHVLRYKAPKRLGPHVQARTLQVSDCVRVLLRKDASVDGREMYACGAPGPSKNRATPTQEFTSSSSGISEPNQYFQSILRHFFVFILVRTRVPRLVRIPVLPVL